MNLASLLLQADAPKWTDVGGFIATSAGVVVTFAAVLVALFGPRWQANRSQPKLSLSVEPAGLEWTVGEVFGAQPMILLLHNAEGRDTAVDVEVFAYVTSHFKRDDGMPSGHVAVDSEPLVFENPLGSNPVRTASSIPSGFSRKAYWALVGQPGVIAQAFAQEPRDAAANELLAAVAVDPYGRTEVSWMWFGRKYLVDLIVTGSNFDAVYFSGVVESVISEADGERDPGSVGYLWTEQPRRVAPEHWKPPVPSAG